jgi:hypothetical protein
MSEQISIDGSVSIIDGALHVTDPQGTGVPAMILPDDSVLVFIHDELLESPTPVYARQNIRLTYAARTPPRYHLELLFNPLRTRAEAIFHLLEPGVTFHLADHPPVTQLQIRTLAQEAPLEQFPELSEHLTAELESQIEYGLLPDAVERLLAAPGTPQTIAVGQEPEVVPETLHWLFAWAAPAPEPHWLLGSERFVLIPPVMRTCKAGERLVYREPRHVLVPGLTVDGTVPLLPIPDPKPLQAQGRAVKVDIDGKEAVSLIEGVPSFNGRDVWIHPKARYYDDVHGQRGGGIIDVKGSVDIAANVEEQAQVWADQHVEIQGSVSHSFIEAGECVVLHGNTIRTRVNAGGDAAASMRLYTPTEELLTELDQILYLFGELRRTVPALQRHSDKVVLVNLIKTQFPGLLDQVNALWELNKGLRKLHPRKNMLLKVVLSSLLQFQEKIQDEHTLADWSQKLREFLLDLMVRDQVSSDIYATYVQGSQLTASGSIYVLGEGCYNSHLMARKHILIMGEPGYFREGNLSLQGRLIVRELGSPNGSRVTIEMPAEGQIFAHTVYPGVDIQMGQAHYHVLQRLENVHFLQDGEGQVALQPLNVSWRA